MCGNRQPSWYTNIKGIESVERALITEIRVDLINTVDRRKQTATENNAKELVPRQLLPSNRARILQTGSVRIKERDTNNEAEH